MNNKRMLLANKLAFGILGALEAAWAPMVPFVKSSMNLNDGQFGQLLLSMGLGSLIALPLVGPLVSRFGPRNVAICSGILLGLNLFGITIVDLDMAPPSNRYSTHIVCTVTNYAHKLSKSLIWRVKNSGFHSENTSRDIPVYSNIKNQ